jgi:hypothetical protein
MNLAFGRKKEKSINSVINRLNSTAFAKVKEEVQLYYRFFGGGKVIIVGAALPPPKKR